MKGKSRRLSTLKVEANDIGKVKSLRFDDVETSVISDDKAFSAMLRDIVTKSDVSVDLDKYFKSSGARGHTEDNLKKLLQLGLAGKETAQKLFIEQLLSLIKSDTNCKSALFKTETGLEVLARLLWCYNHKSQWKDVHPEVVLAEISGDISRKLAIYVGLYCCLTLEQNFWNVQWSSR